VRVTWYDGDRRPPAEVLALLDKDVAPPQGSILVGTDGVLLIPHVAAPRLNPKSRFADFRYPEVPGESHWQLWVEACRGNGRTTADFSYSGPLTEAVLFGWSATRFPQTTLEWNAKKLKFTNVKEANRYVRRRYRKGWSVKKL